MQESIGVSDRERLLVEQQRSGQSIAEFCRMRGVDSRLLYAWRKQQQRKALASKLEGGGRFSPVQVSSSVEALVTIELPEALTLRVPVSCLRAVLRELDRK